MSFSLPTYLKTKRLKVEKGLKDVFKNPGDCPKVLWDSMKYSVFAGGKRLRPVLCLASAEAVGLPEKSALRIACALELIHTYSLIHDDLPSLDNDDYRRGRKTNHKVYGEAMAILAGDGLLTLAFQWLSNPESCPKKYRENLALATYELAWHAGYPGMVGGQVDDVISENKKPNIAKVFSIHRRKTGALLIASTRLPALLAGSNYAKVKALTEYGKAAGLAFQIVDDILNEVGDSKKMGKAAGSDRERGKMTYPSVIGLERSKKEVLSLTSQAVSSLKIFGSKAEPLKALVLHMAERTY